ncbi:hypothetical protein LA303_06075 [Candidatus Sulfidibacterium hydrothermale]|uniref:hypothetical protein n=1 Tax=Candidatus Sulfidibacterium hydrothermale TaxID=2875962 RepID=UPI001F0A7EAE|nr:hypothetical protein [Candidatus Sulfidibacterium hydrothermale]UBM63530.1 hypothetical protein LA303_06075 [Candidatus Sulfidibacterium hydrothermale]
MRSILVESLFISLIEKWKIFGLQQATATKIKILQNLTFADLFFFSRLKAVGWPTETAGRRWGECRKAYNIVQKCLHFSCDEQETLLPEMLLFGRAQRSIRFGASSLVPFLTRQERNKKTH